MERSGWPARPGRTSWTLPRCRTVDFIGPTDGTIFVRQAQLRYTNGPWSVSVENPQTTVTPYLGAAARFNTGDNVAPDITARWLTKGDWGHFTVAGLVRQFKFSDDTETGAAISVSGKFNLGANDDIRYAVNAGSGIGRYLALGPGQRRGPGCEWRPARTRRLRRIRRMAPRLQPEAARQPVLLDGAFRQ